MSRSLLLVRHAKSSWDDPSLADHDRPIAPRGARALPLLRDHVARLDAPPELVLCSTARRTVDTLAGIRPALPPDARIEIEPMLYGATAGSILRRLQLVESAVGGAMVIGHNPGMQDLAIGLTGAGDLDLRAQVRAKLPTAAAVTLSFEGTWDELAAGSAHLDDFFTPRSARR